MSYGGDSMAISRNWLRRSSQRRAGASGQAQKIVTQRTQTVEIAPARSPAGVRRALRPSTRRCLPGFPRFGGDRRNAVRCGFENHFVDVLGRELHNLGGDLAALLY